MKSFARSFGASPWGLALLWIAVAVSIAEAKRNHEGDSGPWIPVEDYMAPAPSSSRDLLVVPHLQQCNAAWGSQMLGTCAETICQSGCALTCAAMLLQANGVTVQPNALNSWLTSHGGYSGGCLIVWSVAATYPGSDMTWYGSSSYQLSTLRAELDGGNPVIANVTVSGFNHFIVVTGYSGSGTSASQFTVLDPLQTNAGLLSSYSVQGLRIFHNVGAPEQGANVTCAWTISADNGSFIPLPATWHMWRGLGNDFYRIALDQSGATGPYAIQLVDGDGSGTWDVLTGQTASHVEFDFTPPTGLSSGGGHFFRIVPNGTNGPAWCNSATWYAGNLPSVSVTVSPSTLIVGENAQVEWQVSGGIPGLPQGGWTGNIRLQWRQNGTGLTDLPPQAVSAGSYDFTVPASISGASLPGCQFQIQGSNAATGTSMPGGQVSDLSPSFCIEVLDPPQCNVQPQELDFGTAAPGEAVSRTFTITNSGGGTLSGSVSESCTGYTISAGGGTYNLSAGQSRQVTVRLQSSTPGDFSCQVQTGGSCPGVDCTGGVEQEPVCEVVPQELDFGTAAPGEAVSRTFTITNSGGGTLSGSVSESCTGYTISAGGGTYNLDAGQFRQVTVRLQSGTPGEFTCQIQSGGNCLGVDCAGEVEAPICQLTIGQPDANTIWILGQDPVVSWSGQELSDQVRLHLESQSLSWDLGFHPSTAQGGTASISLPSDLLPADTYRLRIEDGEDDQCQAQSPLFQVLATEWPVSHFQPVAPTGQSYPILLAGELWIGDDLNPGSEIGVFDGDLCVGAALYLEPGAVVMAQAADPGAGLPGFVSGHPIHFRGWSPGGEECIGQPNWLGAPAVFGEGSGAILDELVINCPPELTLLTGPDSPCGQVDELGSSESGFLHDWQQGLIAVAVQDAQRDTLRARVLVNGVPQWSGILPTGGGLWRPGQHLSLMPWLQENIHLHLEVEDGSNTWNESGETCTWWLDFLSVPSDRPVEFRLHAPVPNPFNPSTSLQVDLPRSTRLRAVVWNLHGAQVAVLHDAELPAGSHWLHWEAGQAASGPYWVVVEAGGQQLVERLILLH
jgi:hypothetical protein